jgi:predicted DsbA family dithiol-disulfide isomerase
MDIQNGIPAEELNAGGTALMTKHIKIDFVSDVSCPWCVIGLKSLEEALKRLGGEVVVDMHFQPFELNPQMGPAGQDVSEHLREKYGSGPEQLERGREALRARGEELGFTFNMNKRTRIYNTFDAHRLLHWAELEGRQQALQHALFAAYFTAGENLSDRETLADIAARAGLDRVRAAQILASGEYADEVHGRERFYLEQGIHAVPAVIFNDRHLIQGGQPVEVFERAIKQIAGN